MRRWVGFGFVPFAFLVTMFGTTLPTPLYPLFQARYSFGELTTTAPVERRGETASSFFVALYVGLSLPVIGVGIAAEELGLKTAGIAFSIAVAALVAGVLASLVRR